MTKKNESKHNYQTKLEKMQAAGELPMAVGLHHVDIYHDDWCGIYNGQRCNCDPDIRLRQTHD